MARGYAHHGTQGAHPGTRPYTIRWLTVRSISPTVLRLFRAEGAADPIGPTPHGSGPFPCGTGEGVPEFAFDGALWRSPVAGAVGTKRRGARADHGRRAIG